MRRNFWLSGCFTLPVFIISFIVQAPNMETSLTLLAREVMSLRSSLSRACLSSVRLSSPALSERKALKFMDKLEAKALKKDDPQLVQSDPLEFWLSQVE